MNEEQREVNGQQAEPAVGQPQATPSGTPAGTMQPDAVMVFLSYFGIFALIPLLTVKDNDFVKWHAKQGITLFVGWTVASIVLGIVTAILGLVLGLIGLGLVAGLLSGLLWLVIGVGPLVLLIMALVKAFAGEKWKIPVIGNLAERW